MRCVGYCRRAECRFRYYLEQIGIDLGKGSILDVACGPVSLACLYQDVHGHDNSSMFVENLASRGISVRLADITELDYPPKSFCYAVSFNPPMKPFKMRDNLQNGIKKFLEDMLSIAQERVIIWSVPLIRSLPSEYNHLLERKGKNYVVYRAKDYPANPAKSSLTEQHGSPLSATI